MKSFTRFISLLSFFLLLSLSLQASHYKGGEVTYESLGGCNYRITVTEYYDCSGLIVTPTQPTGGIEFYDAFAISHSGTALNGWTLVNDTEVINLSGSTPTNCNGGSILGVRQISYQRDYDLCGISAPIKISLNACCRTGTITNLANPSIQSYQYSTDIVNTTIANNSPVWLEPSFTIVPSASNFYATQKSLAAYDAEGDSLVYSLDTVFSAPWQPLNYQAGYSVNAPFGSNVMAFITHAGNLTLYNFTGINIGEYVVGIVMEEYRNGVLLSRSRRDLTMISTSFPSGYALPIIDYWTNSPTNGSYLDSITVATTVGANLSIPLTLASASTTNNTSMTWSQNLPGAQLFEMPSNTPLDTIVSVNPQGELRWTPTAPGRYAFNIKLRDENQPVWNMSDVSYVITVSGAPPCNLTVDISPDSTVLCAGGPGVILSPSTTGGTGPLQYAWSTGETTANILATVDGIYKLWVTDQNNCTALDSAYVGVSNIGVDIGPDTVWICPGDTTYFTANTTGTSPTLLWSTGDTSQTIDMFGGPGPVYVVATDINGCTATDSAYIAISPYCVWPGDADNDLIADNNDLLAIGLTYGDTGPVRPGATLNWEAQQGSAWATSLPSGTNAVFTDTDGNGIVNDDDTLAINLNYGQTHQKTNTEMAGAGDPLLFLAAVNDSVSAGETVNVSINFGVDTLPADSIYGLAFTIQYNNAVVDSFSAHVSYNGWLGTYSSNMLGIQKDFYQDGEVDVALVRKDQQIVSGYGMIANLSIVMIDDIAGKMAASEILKLDLIDVRVIGLDGEEIPVNTEGTEVVVSSGGVNSILDDLAKRIRIYPQPAQDLVYIELDEPQVWEATLYTLSGQQISAVSSLRGTQESLDLSPYANGLYILRIRTKAGTLSKKIMIAR
ncbi:MAG: T9SS type A sorting domain-containing protein [Bacteroidota bacterium]